jgi:hypothetical protein
VRFRGAAQLRLDARQQLAQAERLDHIVVGAALETGHFIRFLAARREHDDRLAHAVGAQLAAQRQAVAAGQHEIQHDEIRIALQGRRTALRHVGGAQDAIALDLEIVPQSGAHGRVVLDDQDGGAGGHDAGAGAGKRTMASRPLPSAGVIRSRRA